MSQDKTKLFRIEEKIGHYFNILWRLGVLLLFIFLVLVVWREVKTEGLVFRPFDMPKQLEDSGFDGGVFAKRIFDKIEEIKESAQSQKSDSVQFNTSDRPDLKMDVLGLGLSANSLSYHIKELLGYESKIITGELTDLDQQLHLSLRLPDNKNYTIHQAYFEGQSFKAVDSIIIKSAEKVIELTDPYRLAIYLYHNERSSESRKLLQQIIEERPHERKWAYLAWGHIYRKEENFERAQDMYENSYKEDENFSLANGQLGWHAFQQKDYETAIYHFEKSQTSNTQSFQSLNGLAYAHLNLNNLQEAEKYLRLNVERNAEVYMAHSNLSSFLFRAKNDSTNAIKVMRDAVALNENSITGLAAMGDLHRMMGQYDSAKYYADRILEIEPNNVTALHAYGRFYYEDLKDYKTANIYFHKLIAIYKTWDGDGIQSIYNMLAMSHYKNMELDSSVYYAKEAIAFNPDMGYPYSTLAEAYYYKGDKKNFYKYLAIAVEKGFELDRFKNDEPYNEVNDEPEFKDLLLKFKD